ncbi:MAG: 4-(cytidine 5'-diphospho)-2-C-methyl-D-erythritol kinase [Nitrospinales bacterium]
MMKLVIKTPAKINLGLYVLSKRPDGYHEIETILQMVSLFDEIELETLSGKVELDCDYPGVPNDSSNLAARAALLLKEAFPEQKDLGCRIKLKKNIPVGAGLGGGSGNAAGILWGLNVLWDLKIDRQSLMDLAAKLGSDVPFFLCSPLALGTGRGEQVESLQPAKKMVVMLVFPRVSIAASAVYAGNNLKLTTGQNNISIIKKNLSRHGCAGLGKLIHNDLEPVVLKDYPVVRELKEKLETFNPEGVLLSGSGSTVFAIFANADEAKQAQKACKEANWDTFLTETISNYSEFLPEQMLNYP